MVEHLASLRRRNLRPSTIYQRNRAIVRLERHSGVGILDITTAQIEAYLDRPVGPATHVTELRHLKGFFGWAVEQGYLAVDPTRGIPAPRLPRRLPRPMPEDALAKALKFAPERVRPWLYLAAYAGLRACEIAPLRGEHIDQGVLYVAVGKGGDSGSVPICSALTAALTGLPHRGWMFPRHDGKPGHVKAWTVSQLANRYLHEIGIDHTLHTCRHRFGTQAYRASGRDLRQTQELLRHRSPVSTTIYTWCDPGEAAETVELLPVAG